jgi:hypothetical protein
MKPELRRELVGCAAALAFVLVAVYAIELITSSLATLGVDWYWWLGFGMFLLPFVLWIGKKKEPSHRRLRVDRAEEIDLAQARYEHVSKRDSYLEDRLLAKQERIFVSLQDRLIEATDDVFADAEKLSDLSGAVSYAADALSQLHYQRDELLRGVA